MDADFETALETFVKTNQDAMDNENLAFPMKFTIEPGKRYVRIVRQSKNEAVNDRSVWGFVDMTNGDILKPASWKTPAKNFARGNIFEDPKKTFFWMGVR